MKKTGKRIRRKRILDQILKDLVVIRLQDQFRRKLIELGKTMVLVELMIQDLEFKTMMKPNLNKMVQSKAKISKWLDLCLLLVVTKVVCNK